MRAFVDFLAREAKGDLLDLILRPYAKRDTVVVGPNDSLTVAYQPQAQFAGVVRKYSATWARIIKASGFQPQ